MKTNTKINIIAALFAGFCLAFSIMPSLRKLFSTDKKQNKNSTTDWVEVPMMRDEML